MGSIGNFDDILEEFANDYCAYVVKSFTNNAAGGRDNCYKKIKARGSLQTGGRRKILSSDGASRIEHTWNFYAGKKFILNEGDYLKDNNGNMLIVTELDPWETEGGYRKYVLIRTTMTENRILDQFKGDINPDVNLPDPDLIKILKEKTLK